MFPIDNSGRRSQSEYVADEPYEICFEVRPMTEDVEDAVARAFDCLIATHSGVTTVTLSAPGPDCVAAATTAIEGLRAAGAQPVRLVDDLVGRSEIARRASITPQAVGLWIRGERHATPRFPAPFILAGGGLWLWGEVVDALAVRDKVIQDGVRYPSRHNSQVIGGMLASDAAQYEENRPLLTGT